MRSKPDTHSEKNAKFPSIKVGLYKLKFTY